MPWLNIAAAAIGGLLSYKSAQQQRKQAIADQDRQYVRMRNAAQRAGFNPLTVMRATGGQGFTGLPTISKAAAFGNAAAGIFDAVKNDPIDKYYEQIRKLELEQRNTTLAIDKLQLDELAKPKQRAVMPAVGMPAAGNIEATELPMTTQSLENLVNGALSRVTRDAAGNYVGDELRPTSNQYVTRSGRVINLPGDEMDAGAVMIGTMIELGDGSIQLYDKATGALSKTRLGEFAKKRVKQIQNLEQTAIPPFSDPNWYK